MAFIRQLIALLRKNLLLKIRAPLEWASEVFLPILFVAAMAGIFFIFNSADLPDSNYASEGAVVQPFGVIPFRVQYRAQKIALVPSSPEQQPIVNDFHATMSAWHPRFTFASLGADAAWTNALLTYAPVSSAAGLRDLVLPGWADVALNFTTTAALESYITSGTYDSGWGADSTANPKIFAAVVFTQGTAPAEPISYAIRMNSSVTPLTDGDKVDVLVRGIVASTISKYVLTRLVNTGPPFLSEKGDPISAKPFAGFTTLQREVDRFAIARKSGGLRLPPSSMINADTLNTFIFAISQAFPNEIIVPELSNTFKMLNQSNPARVQELIGNMSAWLASEAYPPQAIKFVAFPTAAYRFNPFYVFLLNILGFILVIAFVFPNSRLIRGLVLEKETKMREGMKMMGLGDGALFGSHIFWYWFAYHLPVSLIIAGICKATFFPATGYGSTFIIFFLFGTGSTSLMYFISVFFSRSKTASSLGVVLFIAGYFPAFAFSGTTTRNVKRLASLLPPTAFSLGLSSIGTFENNMAATQAAAVVNNWSFGDTIGMLVLDTFLLAFLGWYFDQTLPASFREFGVARPWYFFFTVGFWREMLGYPQNIHAIANDLPERAPPQGPYTLCCRRRPSENSVSTPQAPIDESFLEGPDEALKALAKDKRCVTVSNLVKDFDTPDGVKRAVNNVNLEMYQGQIFVLLGPNGAGKTTAISMMTGLLAPTAGSMSLFGKNLLTETADARESMGVCPQHDVLWPELTVQEHLEIFCAIKGVPSANVARECTKSIVDVGLTEKVNVASSQLSGGMKRKLSVAIALIGGSKVIFLDEPTSGMDPYSRRSTWNILQNAREGRVILLTTHFMDEADILGDRIGIMGNGRVMCSGSPLFLKKKYGVGYVLVLVKTSTNALVDETLALIRSFVPEATISTNIAAEFNIRLPLASAAAFPGMLASLDEKLAALGLASYGISVTSIEDVFLKIAEKQARENALLKEANLANQADALVSVGGGSNPNPAFIKVLPVGGPEASESVQSEMPTSIRKSTSTSMDTIRSLARVEQSGLNAYFSHTNALLRKRVQYALRDRTSQCYQLLLPGVLILLGLALLQLGAKTTFEDYKFVLTDFNQGTVAAPRVHHFDFKAGTGVDSPAIAALTDAFIPGIAAAPSIAFTVAQANAIVDPQGWIKSTSTPVVQNDQRMSAFLIADRLLYEDSSYGSYTFNRAVTTNEDAIASLPQSAGLSASIFVNTSGYHTPGVFLNLMDSALHKSVGGAGIITRNWPLPKTKLEAALFSSVFVFLASLIIIIAFAFVASNVALYIVREKEVAAKHQQIISGVSIAAYWTSNLIFDYATFCVPAGIALILLKLFNVQEFTSATNDREASIVLNFFLFGLAMTLHTYLLCFFFKSPSSAQSAVLFINISAVVLVTATQFLSQLESTCRIERGLRYVFPLLPTYGFGANLLTVSFLDQLHLILATCDKLTNQKPITSALDTKATGFFLLYFFVESVAFLGILLTVEHINAKPALRQYFFPDKQVPFEVQPEDEDVVAESARIEAAVRTNTVTDAITIHDLRKVYAGGKTAVRKLSYGVPTGEVFGFLGINGAGKTTTLQILSGDVLPSGGTAMMAGYDILTQQPQVRRLLGYCPQHDSLLELLTVKEHLELYARIKGVREHELAATIATKIAELDLGSFVNKTAGSLSGGNKRKLCVAIALIGNPPLVFLDEPSTGMDPVAKRFMWGVISKVATERKMCSIILTTHSMEEAEALCGRIGIMVGGRLRCLGSSQHLKARHGNGYAVELRLAALRDEAVAAVMRAAVAAGAGEEVTSSAFADLAARLGAPKRVEEVSETGTGWALLAAWRNVNGGGIPLHVVAEWWAGEQRVHDIVTYFCGGGVGDTPVVPVFPSSAVTERQGNLIRLKVPNTGAKLADLFRAIELAKVRTGLDFEASLGQTTLENIFVGFAAEQEEEKGIARGSRG